MNKYQINILSAVAFAAIVLSVALPTKAIPTTAAPASSTGRDRSQASYPAQPSVAAKGSFGDVTANASEVARSIDAKDLAGAGKRVGKPGAFQGTVSKVYSPRGHNIVILDFDPNYRSALTAVIKPEDYAKFPSTETLTGKHVVVSGRFIDYDGHPEIVLTNPSQIKLIK